MEYLAAFFAGIVTTVAAAKLMNSTEAPSLKEELKWRVRQIGAAEAQELRLRREVASLKGIIEKASERKRGGRRK